MRRLCFILALLLVSGCAGTPGPQRPAAATVTGVQAEAVDGGGIRLMVTFDGAIPVWAIHSSSHGQMLWLELSVPAVSAPPDARVGEYHYGLGTSSTASWVTVIGRGVQAYRTRAEGNSLVLEVAPAPGAAPLSDGGFKGLEGVRDVVERFLAAQVNGTDLNPYLTETARAQYGRLPPFRPTEYQVTRQSGQVPDTLLYQVRLSNPQAFTDQFLFVTPGGTGPQISLILGHRPVVRPTDPEGSAALAVAFAYLDAWAKRDANGMYAALAPAAQQSLSQEARLSLGGLSNPHPFRYEVHALEKVAPGCYRLQVLQSMEYTGEGELGRGMGPLYVTAADGRYGVLLEGACGDQAD